MSTEHKAEPRGGQAERDKEAAWKQTRMLQELAELDAKGELSGVCVLAMNNKGALRLLISPNRCNILELLGGAHMMEEQLCAQIKQSMGGK